MASVNAGPTEAQAEAGALEALGRKWWLLLLFGVVTIVVGIFCVMQPVDAVETLSWLFAVWLIVTGADVAIDPVEITKFLNVGLSPVPNPKLVRAVG
jgi:hypothetical protein